MAVAIEVLLPLPVEPLSYLPPSQRALPPAGARVVVPWRGGIRVGLLVGQRPVSAGRALELKEAVDWLDREPFIATGAVAALLRIARHAAVPAGVALATLAPWALHDELRHEVRPVVGSSIPELSETFTWVSAERIPAERLAWLREQGLVEERVSRSVPTVRVLAPLAPVDANLAGARRHNQRRALERLWDLEAADSAAALARDAGVPESAVRALVEKGYAEYREVDAPPPALPHPLTEAATVTPVPDAAVPPAGDGLVVGGLRAQRLAALKPRVRADLDAGRSVLVLAPEHVRLVEAVQALAGLPLQVLSGELHDDQRGRLFEELPSSGAVVLVGTYLALLAPVARLARVVVLDAGSASYKLQRGARLFVPHAAALLAEASGAALTLTDAVAGPEVLVGMPPESRRSLPLPRLRLHAADMAGSGNWPLHPDLVRVLKQVQERGRQAVLVVPRRGFSAALGCAECGYIVPCPNCDLSLRYHRQDGRLRCHQCGHEQVPPVACPSCGGSSLEPLRGAGTQWVASQLASMLPGFRVLRFDRDRRDDVGALAAGEPGVVVGTTAVLRLPPLPQLSLLALTLFDTHLAIADFRAEEEALRLLLELGELAGDRRPLVLVQTYQPEHPVLQALAADAPDAAVEALLGRQLERRRRFSYPPFGALAKLQVAARDAAAASDAASALAVELRRRGAAEREVLGPAPAPVARVKARYAFQLLLREDTAERLERLLTGLPSRLGKAVVRVDVDPRDVGELLE
ncbi:MAG: primosomal protein N' [Deinococcales bacterium]